MEKVQKFDNKIDENQKKGKLNSGIHQTSKFVCEYQNLQQKRPLENFCIETGLEVVCYAYH